VTPRFTCGTGDLGAADTARAGGKAAALGELARAGLLVPRGYVVMVAAFGLHMDATSRSPTGGARASARTAWPWASSCSGCCPRARPA